MSLALDVSSANEPLLPMGVQRPRVQHLPSGICSTAGSEFIDLADACGLVLDDWQRYHVRAMLAQARDGEALRWAAMENASVVARQNGKGAIITVVELGFLFLRHVPVILHTAHEVGTAKEGFGRLLEVVDGCDELRRQVVRVSRARGDEALELTGGRRLLVKARTTGAGRGLSVPVLVWDEAYALTADQIAAQMPIMAAQADPWVGYFSSAALATSAALHRLRRRALSGDGGRLVYLEHSADPDAFGGRESPGWARARRDPAVWAMAQPGLGIRVRHATIAVLAESMPPERFDREMLSVPDDEALAAGGAISLERWAVLADGESDVAPGSTLVGVVDVSPGGRCSIVFAGRRVDGRRHVELVDNREGTGWVPAEIDRLSAEYGVRLWVRDPSGPAVELGGEFRNLTGPEYAAAAAGFVTAANDDRVPLADQFRVRVPDDLEARAVDALRGAVRRVRGDGTEVWARARSDGDISPLVAMSIGWWAAGLPVTNVLAAVH